eukprot:GEMP01081424.1.p1 GENE.GEMP01081424.1~~GEMP01081424.1.p1  ORF type:complete len:218 (+),score=49.79 GEMP01081424.1:96-749(+)
MSGYDTAVERVKELQRSDPEGKERWISYTQEYGEGKRDPKAHDEDFINSFFDAYEAGTINVHAGKRGSPCEIFVGGLPKDCTEEIVMEYFANWVPVERVIYKGDKGYCFVTFKDEYAVATVLENADRHEILGKWVDCKRTSENNKGTSGAGKGKGKSKGKGGKDSYGGGKDSYGGGKGSYGSKGGYGKDSSGGKGGYGKSSKGGSKGGSKGRPAPYY